MNEQIEKIRAACIAANPSIREQYKRCMGCGFGFEFCTKTRMCPIAYRDREIRLADTLFAYQANFVIKGDLPLRMQAQMAREGFADISTRWNLRKDDLEQQSDETISFIHSLLLPENHK